MNIIVCMDKNHGIGYKGKLLERIPGDMMLFRNMTINKVVVMGRKTWESLPNKPLDGRINIVLTSDKNYKVENALVVHSEEELLGLLKLFKSNDIYIIGGQKIYEMMMKYCDNLIITYLFKEYEHDAKFPDIEVDDWECIFSSPSNLINEKTETEYSYHFFKRRNRE